jgi:hypothetical protein
MQQSDHHRPERSAAEVEYLKNLRLRLHLPRPRARDERRALEEQLAATAEAHDGGGGDRGLTSPT